LPSLNCNTILIFLNKVYAHSKLYMKHDVSGRLVTTGEMQILQWEEIDRKRVRVILPRFLDMDEL
jgi:hypothetical protein